MIMPVNEIACQYNPPIRGLRALGWLGVKAEFEYQPNQGETGVSRRLRRYCSPARKEMVLEWYGMLRRSVGA